MISSPTELRGLNLHQLEQLAEDIRGEIIQTCLANGGHLGASLGTVELAIALHRAFDSPSEPIVWDVGHQAYAHKLLTGRWDAFHTLRLSGGVSGFLNRDESIHDVFGAGHSSTSLSAALAMAWARRSESEGTTFDNPRWTVAVIGDGGLTSGLALEALNQIPSLDLGPLLIVVNDNQMSISPNVGAVSQLLVGGRGRELFGNFGLQFLGPVDGHRLFDLGAVLDEVRRGIHGPRVVLHVLTQKGRGYAPAEESPEKFHGVGPVSAKPGPRFPPGSGPRAKSWSEAAGQKLIELAEKDPRVVAVTAAMAEGTGLQLFAQRFPDRFFDVGIAEGHAVTFAAALATQGYLPYVAVYSTFLQRAYDSLIHDVVLQRLPVTFLLDRAGFVGADGPTHHGVLDLAYLSCVPGLSVFTPATYEDLWSEMERVPKGPRSFRYPRGGGVEGSAGQSQNVPGFRFLLEKGADETALVLLAVGACELRVQQVINSLSAEERERVTAVSLLQVSPLRPEVIDLIQRYRKARWLTVEEGVLRGGVGSALAAQWAANGDHFVSTGIHDRWVPQGTVAEQDAREQLDCQSLLNRVQSLLSQSVLA